MPGYSLQDLIDTGAAWRLEGSAGRAVMDALRTGECVLPEVRRIDAYGNTVPSRHDVLDEVGSPGSVANHEAWRAAHDGDHDLCTASCGCTRVEDEES